MRVAFLHRPGSRFLTGSHFSPYFHNFFYKALQRSTRIQYEIIQTDNPSAAMLNRFDVVLLFALGEKLGRINVPSGVRARLVANAYDSSMIDKKTIETANQCGCKHFFYHHAPAWFYKFAPADWEYKQVQMVLEPSDYEHVAPWHTRQSEVVLLTGRMNHPEFYRTRRALNHTPMVKRIPQHDAFSGAKYPFLLQNFRAHVSACTVTTVNKYTESMAAGCLTFAEANKENGYQALGLRDMENCVFINEGNCVDKVAEYLETREDPKWQAIADAGRAHAMSELNNDKQVDILVDWMEAITTGGSFGKDY